MKTWGDQSTEGTEGAGIVGVTYKQITDRDLEMVREARGAGYLP
jgi:predicted DNA binding protein